MNYILHSLGSNGDTYNIDPMVYDQFLSWLAARSDVVVKTVGDVMATAWPPPTTTTTASSTTTTTTPPPPVTVPIGNPGLEADANRDGISDCWLRGAAGSTIGGWQRTNNAHSGDWAEEVTITSYTSGDRKLVSVLDGGTASGGCAPSVSPTTTYTMNVWYRSTGVSSMVVFTRDSAGVWKYWKTGPKVPTSRRQTSFSPGTLPSGTTALSFGLALNATGTLATDDYSLVQDQAPVVVPADTSVKNASFETDSNADGVADCWIRGGYGTSTFSFQRVQSGRTGSWAQQLTISSLSSGDRKIVQPLDKGQAAGGCALDVVPGTQYWLSSWYTSTTTPLLFVYLRDSLGVWRWWISTLPYPPSVTWSAASFLTPPIPAGTTAMSFGLGLTGVGSLTIDDASSTVAQ